MDKRIQKAVHSELIALADSTHPYRWFEYHPELREESADGELFDLLLRRTAEEVLAGNVVVDQARVAEVRARWED